VTTLPAVTIAPRPMVTFGSTITPGHSRAECDVFLDYYALLFTIMRDNGGPYSNRRAVTNGDQVRTRCFYYRIIPYPNIFPDVDTAPAVEADARSCGAWYNSSEHLKNRSKGRQPPVFDQLVTRRIRSRPTECPRVAPWEFRGWGP
jgi:hypothetical protein